jgi:hypothetical protein
MGQRCTEQIPVRESVRIWVDWTDVLQQIGSEPARPS